MDGWEGNSSTVMTWGQSEDTLTLDELENVENGILTLRVGEMSLESANIFIHGSDVISISENESSFLVESTGNDVLGILETKVSVMSNILLVLVSLHEVFLVISQLNNDWALEHVLQPLCEEERKTMSKMHTTGRSSSCIQKHRLSFFELLEELMEVSMTEENT